MKNYNPPILNVKWVKVIDCEKEAKPNSLIVLSLEKNYKLDTNSESFSNIPKKLKMGKIT